MLLWQTLATVTLSVALVFWLRCYKAPLIPRSIFSNRTVVCGFLSAFGMFYSVALLRFMVPYYLQEKMGYTQGKTGLVMMVQPVMM